MKYSSSQHGNTIVCFPIFISTIIQCCISLSYCDNAALILFSCSQDVTFFLRHGRLKTFALFENVSY